MSGPETRSGPSRGLSSVGLPMVGVVVAVAVWWLAILAFGIRPFFLPSPAQIVDRFRVQPGYLLREAGTTLMETVAGFGIAMVAGLAMAVLLAASRTVERATLPVLVAVNSVPKVALAPLLLVWLGFGPRPKIAMAVLICFFPLVVAAMAGLSATPTDLAELSRSLTASWLQSFLKIRLPWALPQIFVGLKVAMSLAPIGAVVAEINNPDHGLGSVIVQAMAAADTPLAFASIALLAVLSVSLYYLVAAVERLVLPWAREITT